MTRKLDPEERVLEELLEEGKEVSKKEDKQLDDLFNYDTYSK